MEHSLVIRREASHKHAYPFLLLLYYTKFSFSKACHLYRFAFCKTLSIYPVLFFFN